jgi:hypothetical protein
LYGHVARVRNLKAYVYKFAKSIVSVFPHVCKYRFRFKAVIGEVIAFFIVHA